MINPAKRKKFVYTLFSRGTTKNSYLMESTIDQFRFYCRVLNTPIILSFMLLLPRDMSDPGHPNPIIRLKGMTVFHSETVKQNFDQITHRSILGFLIL